MKRRLPLLTVAALWLLAFSVQAQPPEVLPLISAGRYIEAQQLLAPYLATHPEDLASKYWYGRALLGVGQRAAAEQQFRAILEKKPDSLDSRLFLAQTLYERGRADEARAQLQELLRRSPGHGGATKLLDQINRNLGPMGAAPAELSGGRIAFVNGGLPVDPGDLSLQSYNVKDYTFNNAPSDWLITSGTWATTNRWTCQPQWSWYGGFANNAPAAIWTKEEFSGDVEVEMYLAYKMGTDIEGRAYKNPNDLCITLCGDGGNLDSGYSFMLGADRNTATRILRGTTVLAETNAAENLLPSWANGQPSTYRWHRHWWALRARKVGDLLQFFMDEKLLLQVRDPNPLQSGRVAVWTYDNGIIIPRVKIYYQQTVRPRSEPAGAAAWVTPVTRLAPRPVTISSPSHPAVENDFEFDLGRWRSLETDPPAGALLTLVPGGPAGSGHCLALINRSGGGHFGAMISETTLDARRYPRLSFDYRIPPEAKVNFYLASGGRWWEIVFTGLESPAPRGSLIGKIPGVIADNQWHHAEFDLLSALQAATGFTDRCLFSHLHLGNFNPTGYLTAGFGGNPAGCTWYLDNFYLGGPVSDRTLLLDIKPASGSTVTGYSCSIDQNPVGLPTGGPSAEPPTEMKVSGPGQWYLHVRAAGVEGPGVVTYPFRVDDLPPRLASAIPADGARIGDGDILLNLDPGAGSGVEARSLKLEVNGKLLTAADPGVTVDPQAPAVRLNPAEAGVTLKPGEGLQVRLTSLSNHAGVALTTPAVLNYRYDPALDPNPPPAPRLAMTQRDLLNADFERDLGGLAPWNSSGDVALALDPSTAASGRSSLRVTNTTTGGQFGVRLAPSGFDAGKYRLVSFDYNFEPGTLLDLQVSMDGQWWTLQMTNTDPTNVIGKIEGAVADGKWHHVELDIYQLLRQRNPQRSSYYIDQLVLGDSGWLGNSKHAWYHLDNVRISPLQSGREGLSVAWTAPTLGGIEALAYKFDSSPDGVPETEIPATNPVVLPAPASFSGFLHVRVKDRAGRWSDTTTRRLLVDSSQPTATILEPAAGSRATPDAIRLRLASTGLAGIDPQSITLAVAGKDYRVDRKCLVYDAATSELVWYPDRADPAPIIFPDGQTVDVQLKAARDFAGNSVATLPRWSWTMDFSKDKTGPAIQQFTSPSHPTFFSATFDDGRIGPVAALKNATVTTALKEEGGTDRCVVVRKTAAAPLAVRLLESDFSSDKYPVLAFSYKCSPETHLNVVAQMGDRRYVWAFSGPVAGTVGWVSNVKLDNQWHQAVVRLTAPLVDTRDPKALIVSGLYLYEQQTGQQLPVGGEFQIDNVMVAASSAGPIVARWRAGDATGIKGFSYLLTQDPAALPPEEVMDTRPEHRFDAVPGGLWLLRLRALDGAGNWGPVFTYTLLSTSAR